VNFQWFYHLPKKKLGNLSFEDGSESGFMLALKNHIDLGLYNTQKSKRT
jgi:hypothetical protein